MFEAIINTPYCRRLIVARIRKLKRVHKLGQYSEVHTFACVYLKPKPNKLMKCALYHKMIQYGIILSTMHPSEPNNKFDNSYLKSIIFKIKIKLLTIFQLRLRYFVIKKNIGVTYFADIRFGIVLVQIDRQK